MRVKAIIENGQVILVTGAGGKTGLAVIRALRARRTDVRAFVRREEQRTTVASAGVQDTVIGDMRDAGVLEAALQGVASVCHICPTCTRTRSTSAA